MFVGFSGVNAAIHVKHYFLYVLDYIFYCYWIQACCVVNSKICVLCFCYFCTYVVSVLKGPASQFVRVILVSDPKLQRCSLFVVLFFWSHSDMNNIEAIRYKCVGGKNNPLNSTLHPVIPLDKTQTNKQKQTFKKKKKKIQTDIRDIYIYIYTHLKCLALHGSHVLCSESHTYGSHIAIVRWNLN